ncbi:MAG: hypothetical protein ACREAA_21280, partial [Candidatus Polarisedimenticolia bacterium]
DTIVFNIPGAGPHTITPSIGGPLPAVTETLTIDASAELLPSGAPGVVLSGGSCGTACDGLTINTQDTIVRALAINNFPGSGVRIEGGTGNSVRACFIGVEPDGTTAAGNQDGVLAIGTSAPDVGGGSSADGCLISGNVGRGVRIANNTLDASVQFSTIGTTRNGLSPLPNDGGVTINGDDGGTAFNTISGNTGSFGIRALGQLNLVRLNAIGTDPSGVLAVPNSEGVHLESNDNDVIQNRISGNADSGVKILGTGSTGNLVRQNMIGLKNSDPPEPLPNGDGVLIDAALDNLVELNFISGNLGPGVRLQNGATGNDVTHNWIGIGDDLITPVGNAGGGVRITGASNNIVGGREEGTGNVISANGGPGVSIEDAATFTSTGNLVGENFIGTDVTGTAAMGNMMGVVITGSSGNQIGTFFSTAAGMSNIISGNGTNVIIQNSGLVKPSNNMVRNNCFGTDASCTMAVGSGGPNVLVSGAVSTVLALNVVGGNHTGGFRIHDSEFTAVENNDIGASQSGAPLGHSGPGVLVEGVSSGTRIGFRISKSGSPITNRIRNNNGDGIQVLAPAADNFFEANLIHSNGGLGINLGLDGPTANDPLDLDMGPNRGQNFPVLTAASTSGGDVAVEGTLQSTPSRTFQLELFASSTCDPSGHGEGERRIGFSTATTTSVGSTALLFTLLASVLPGEFITATASSTGITTDTSEFSACIQAVPSLPEPVLPTTQMFPGGTDMGWEPVAGAQSYTLYRGVPADLAHLPATTPATLQGVPNACTRWSGTTTSTGPILTEVPSLGSFFWYLVSATGLYGESGVGEGSMGPREIVSAGPCSGSNCPHDKCIQGNALTTSCGGCVASICAVDPYCCNTAWDNICVARVRTVCNNLTCLESAGSCNHTLCSFGPTLTSGCDVPPLSAGCVSQICAADPFCCDDHWDATCINEVTTICGKQCD